MADCQSAAAEVLACQEALMKKVQPADIGLASYPRPYMQLQDTGDGMHKPYRMS